MDIKRLSLTYFRNFARVDEVFLPPGALLVAAAPNASGKTNFLESIAVLLRGRSWRSGIERCVQWGKEGFALQADIRHKESAHVRIGAYYQLGSKGLRLEENDVPASVVTYYGRYPLVLFLAEDTFLFARGPEQRRNFINSVLVGIPSYVAALVHYMRALKQRNAALKRAGASSEVQVWTTPLVEQATTIWKHRESFTAFLNTHLNELYAQLVGESLDFQVRLATRVHSHELEQKLREVFSEEQRLGHTVLGPHRDDLVITVHNRLVQDVLSQGQMRSLVLALKIVAHRFLAHTTQEQPLLLLDEALSELDEKRQQQLLKHLPHTQTLLTCTSVPKGLQEREDVHLLDLRLILKNARVETPPREHEAASPVPVG